MCSNCASGQSCIRAPCHINQRYSWRERARCWSHWPETHRALCFNNVGRIHSPCSNSKTCSVCGSIRCIPVYGSIRVERSSALRSFNSVYHAGETPPSGFLREACQDLEDGSVHRIPGSRFNHALGCKIYCSITRLPVLCDRYDSVQTTPGLHLYTSWTGRGEFNKGG